MDILTALGHLLYLITLVGAALLMISGSVAIYNTRTIFYRIHYTLTEHGNTRSIQQYVEEAGSVVMWSIFSVEVSALILLANIGLYVNARIYAAILDLSASSSTYVGATWTILAMFVAIFSVLLWTLAQSIKKTLAVARRLSSNLPPENDESA